MIEISKQDSSHINFSCKIKARVGSWSIIQMAKLQSSSTNIHGTEGDCWNSKTSTG